MAVVRVGKLNRRVTIQTRVEHRSASGEVSFTWEDWRTRWAAVMPLSGNKYIAAEQVETTTTHEIRLRYEEGFRTDQRVKHQTSPGVYEYFAIDAVLPIEDDHHRLSFMCTMRDAAGWR